MLTFVLLLLTSLSLEVPPAGGLAAIQQRFGREPRAATEAALAQLVAATNDGRARVWLGNLLYEDGALDRARAVFTDAMPSLPSLAHRGLGDIATTQHAWGRAAAEYARALDGAPPAVAAELEAKRAVAVRERKRQALEGACWAVYLLSALWLASRLRGQRLVWPLEVTFLAPVYALFLAVAWTHGREVVHALAFIAGGSLVAVALLFGGTRRSALYALVAIVMHAALIFVALHRSGLLEKALFG